jgi:hypothetical protein
MLSTHLRLRIPSGLFLSGFPTNDLRAVLFSPIPHSSAPLQIFRDVAFTSVTLRVPEHESADSNTCGIFTAGNAR